jgi:tight adherence protein C
MYSHSTISLVAFLCASSLALLVSLLVTGRKTRLETRLEDLTGEEQGPALEPTVAQIARSALPRVGQALVPNNEKDRSFLQTRLIHAGLYNRQAMPIFLGVKLLLIVGPALVGLLAAVVGLVPYNQGILLGGCLGIVGIIGPSFWLDSRKRNRQTVFRRALPDALDVLVICLEGGLSLPASVRRVADELRTAHPELALELNIVQRETQLGRTSGEALRGMGDRVELEELRSLASLIIQADQFGASLAKSLRVHAETLRDKRMQRAEELAQKAATKLLIPTILLIFPAIFVVILGPAGIHLFRTMRGMGIGF